MNEIIVDVREKDEFMSEHVEGAVSLPLSDFPLLARNLLQHFSNQHIVFMCRSGNRAKLAVEQLAELGIDLKVVPQVTGILQWKDAGKPTVRMTAATIPALSQIRPSRTEIPFDLGITIG